MRDKAHVMVSRVATVALVSILVAACSGGGTAISPGADAELIARALERDPEDDLDVGPGPDVGGQALRDEVFADGVVTFDEYERALLAEMECVEAAGHHVTGLYDWPKPAVPPGTILGYAAADDVPGLDPGDTMRRCSAQWSYHIKEVWYAKTEPTEAAVEAWYQRAWACAEPLGIEISDPPTENETLELAFHPDCDPWTE